jgi:hypothetical protein
LGIRPGTNPSPVNLKTINASSATGTGRKKPVSALLTASMVLFWRSYRKMFETPVV